jgi:hypothetical protein
MGRIPQALRAERGPFFSWGEPFRAERAHHLDASGRTRASECPGARSAGRGGEGKGFLGVVGVNNFRT